MDSATIAAVATPMGGGGIGIIRISGPDAVAIAGSIFRRSGTGTEPSGGGLSPHRLHYGHIIHPDTGAVVDEVLLAVMPGPRSYTREDVVEIQAHASPAALRAILALVTERGARPAGPGEFTLRAFLNGRIDLTQAEAVADLINARTDRARSAAMGQVGGDLRRRVEAVRAALLDLLASLEAAIDFPDDVEEPFPAEALSRRLSEEVIGPLSGLIGGGRMGRYLREGATVVVAGRPNVGKSSLVNALLDEERVIVSPHPGTTRDLVDVTLDVDGLPVVLADTAGLHETTDPLERLGVGKTHGALRRADAVLLVVDASRPLGAEDGTIYRDIRGTPHLLVANKWDLVAEPGAFHPPDDWHSPEWLPTSARFGTGIEGVRERLKGLILDREMDETEERVSPSERHLRLLRASMAAGERALAGVREGLPEEFVTIELRDALEALGKITGETISPDLLGEIFDRFCIGK